MYRVYLVVAVALLLLNGVLSGIWTHRWKAWTDAEIQATANRIEFLPLHLDGWEGKKIDTSSVNHPEVQIGRGVTVNYTNVMDKTTVTVYLACGPTAGLIGHDPKTCYTDNGYTYVPPEIRVSLDPLNDEPAPQFNVTNLSRSDAAVPTYFRVFWALSDGTGMQAPQNALKAFRRSPVIYKCYLIRQLTTLDEPIVGDPAMRLMAVLVPKMNEMLKNSH